MPRASRFDSGQDGYMAPLRLRLPASRKVRALLLTPLVLATLLILAAVIAYSRVKILAPQQVALPEATLAYYDDGRTEMFRQGTNRTSVPLSAVPVHVRHAVLAA